MQIRTLSLKDTELTGGFWKSRTDMVAGEAVPYQWDTLNNKTPGAPVSHAVENFRIAAGEAEGKPQGIIFHDSDVGKWIEAASYSLMSHPDDKLEATIDELVRLIAKSQKSDGYVNTYFIAAGDEHRWSDLKMGHELYCAGHMMEAAVAYHKATGKGRLLDVMCRFADCIGEEFGPGEGQNRSFGGHPEIELALYRLADATGEGKYADLAKHFLDVRGTVDDFHVGETADPDMNHDNKWFRNDYFLAHAPVRQMRSAEGHAVRAVYLYAAMADLALREKDEAMETALKAIWRDMVDRKMYITAGLGPQGRGERFTVDYDLPPDTDYNETCASVGLVFWAWRMARLDPRGEYGDVIETALFNGALSGMSLDGREYFYVNPLEVNPAIAEYRYDHDHVETARVPWFECACCPTNIARLVASVAEYAVSWSDEAVWVHQYASGRFSVPFEGGAFALAVETDYPWDGRVRLTVDAAPARRALFLRVPGWCSGFSLSVNGRPHSETPVEDGFIRLERDWKSGDLVELVLEMPVRFVRAHGSVVEAAGKVAVRRGPVVYCLEEQDNGPGLHRLIVDPDVVPDTEIDDSLAEGTQVVLLGGYREEDDGEDAPLYAPLDGFRARRECRIRAVPYYQWGNRERNREMRVWLRSTR